MKGISLVLTIVVVAIALAIVLGSAETFVSELVASQNVHHSTVAFYVADAGLEGALFQDRNGGGLADGFVCTGNGNGISDDNENGDTCLDKIDNQGIYTYTVNGVTPLRRVTATATFLGVKRFVEVTY